MRAPPPAPPAPPKRAQTGARARPRPRPQPVSAPRPQAEPRAADPAPPEPRGGSVVPWRSKAEWDQVMVYLFCSDSKLQKYALDRVSAWKSRCANNLPLAVACTADLVRCKVMDDTGAVGSQELVFLYGMALVRFVNLITEPKQKLINIPLRRLAHEMHIPEWIVNLRHDFTHRKLPRLNTCRRGCDFVLDWLRRTYWCRQLGNDLSEPWDPEMDFLGSEMDGEEPAVVEPRVEDLLSKEARKEKELYEKIRRVLVSYEEEQFRVLRELRQLPKAIKAWANSSTEVDWMVSKMKRLTQDNGPLVVNILLSDGFLIPTAEQLEALQIQAARTMNLTNLVLPRCFSHFWQPLLKGLESQPFTQALLEKMLSVLPEFGDTGIRPAYLISWISELLVVYGPRGEHFTSSQRAIRKTWKIVCHNFSLDWSQLLDVCLDCACWATPPILQLVLKTMEPAFPLDTQEKLMCLCTIYTQGGNPNSRPRTREEPVSLRRPIYTLEDLQWRVKQSMMLDRQRSYKPGDDEETETETEDLSSKTEEELEEERRPVRKVPMRERPEVLAEKQAALKGSAWQLCTDDIDWSKYPLGRVPGQTDDPNELMLDNYTMMSVVDQPTIQENDNFPSAATHGSRDLETPNREGLLWTQSELHRIKSNLKFF